jgi:hypothetical protein
MAFGPSKRLRARHFPSTNGHFFILLVVVYSLAWALAKAWAFWLNVEVSTVEIAIAAWWERGALRGAGIIGEMMMMNSYSSQGTQ